MWNNARSTEQLTQVCATGTKWANLFDLPNSRDDSITMLHGFQKNIAAAKKLLVVGGGAVGIGTLLLYLSCVQT